MDREMIKNGHKFYLYINQKVDPIIHNIVSVDGNVYMRVSYEKFVAYCKKNGFIYKTAINMNMPLSITNVLTGNTRHFNLSAEGNISDIWICEEDPSICLVLSHIIDAKSKI